jgi:hypothetical protein
MYSFRLGQRLFTMASTKELKRVNTTQRLAALRKWMQHENYQLEGYIVPSEDAHQVSLYLTCLFDINKKND